MANRIGWQIVLLVPLARPLMQDRYSIGLLLHQACLQNIGEEMVIAIPLALVIERNDEQVATLQGLQHSEAIFLPGDGIAQRTT